MHFVRTSTILLFSTVAIFAADSGLVSLVMPDARLIAGADLEKARASSFGRFVLDQMQKQSQGDFEKTIAEVGFDPRRDLREVIFASVDGQPGKGGNTIFGAKGAFDVSRISSFVKTFGKESVVSSYQGVDILSPDATTGLAFLDASTAVLGESPSVKNAIDRRRTGRRISGASLASIQDISERNDLWFVSTVSVADIAKQMPPGVPGTGPDSPMAGMLGGDAFKGIEQFMGGLKLGQDAVTFNLEATTRTEKDAVAMADVVRFLSGMIQMNRDKPEMAAAAAAFDAMQLKTEGSRFKLSISVPQSQLEKMFESQKVPARRAALR